MWTNSLQHSFILEGKKAEFYLEITQNSVKDLLDRVSDFGWDINQEDNLGSITGCVIFDNATVKQKVYLIHWVLNALLNSSIPAPNPTHIFEAAAYFPLAYLQEQIEIEIDQQRNLFDRKLNQYEKEYFEQYFYLTYYRRKVHQFYQETLLSLEISRDIFDQDHEFGSLEECQEYYQEKLKFNPDSLKFQEWETLINDIAHE